MPRDSLSSASTGGPASSEGRQSGVVDQVAFLRRLEAAVDVAPIVVGVRNPVPLPALKVWRCVCLGDMGVERVLATYGLKSTPLRRAALNGGFLAIADRVADAIGEARSPV